MTQRSWPVQLLFALAMDWWVVAGSVAVAVAVAAGANLTAKTTYEASAVIAVDSVTIAANSRLPKPDAVVAESQDASFSEELAEETGQDVGVLREGLNAFSSGNPQNKVTVTFTSPEKQTALDVADAGGELLQARAEELLEPELERQRALVAESRAALKVLDTAEDQSTVAADRWTIRRNLIIDELNLTNMEASYEYGGAPAVEATSRRSKVIAASLAGLLLGLVAGVLLVAVRDYVRRRPQAESD